MNNALEQNPKHLVIESRGEGPARTDFLKFGRSAVKGMVVLVLGASGCTLDAMGECDTDSCGSKGDASADSQAGTGGVAGTGGEPDGGAGTAGFSGSGGETGGSAGEAGSAGTGGIDASAGTGGEGGLDAGPDVIEETAEADVEAEAGEDVIDSEAGDSAILCDPADPNSITVVTEDECFKGMQYSVGGAAVIPEGSTPDGVACQKTPYCMKNMQPGSFGFLTVENTLNGCITVHHAAQLKTPGLYGICVNDYSAAPGPTQAEMKNKFMSGGYNALTANSSDNPVTVCYTCPTGTWVAYRLDVAP